MRHRFLSLPVGLMLIGAAAPEAMPLAGTWVMESAYEVLADGTRTTNYGEHPSGLMMIDESGRYSIQIFRPDRAPFRSGIKTRGEATEYRAAVLGSSTHFGKVHIDEQGKHLLFDVQAASFPNWEGKRQVRDFTYRDGILSYSVPASASGNGTVAFSVWRRVSSEQ